MGNNILIHTDGTKTYNRVNADQGQPHDSVIHSYRGDGPEYAAARQHTLTDGTTLETTGGTCSLDGWWKWGKQAVQQTNRSNPAAMHRKIRVKQWQTWRNSRDRWVGAAAEIVQELFID